MTLHSRISGRMKRRHLTAPELARSIGVSSQAIYKILHGETQNPRNLRQIARELGTTESYLMGWTDDPDAQASLEALSDEEREWIALLRGLRPVDRGAVMQLTRSLAQSADRPTVNAPAQDYHGEDAN